VRFLILGCRIHLDEPTITTGDSIFMNEQLQLLYRLERRLQQHVELSEYQEAFLQACEDGKNSDWEEELLSYLEVLQRALTRPTVGSVIGRK